ncbi:MAG: hypothetical protein HOV79_30035 [Hamadaea sp.]|nr:hypothetical protein [Hamadaea sp.]
MSTVLLPRNRFVEPPGVALARADGDAVAEELGEAGPVGEVVASARPSCVLAAGPAGPASVGPPHAVTAASMAAATALVNAACRGRQVDRISMYSYVSGGERG